MKYFLTSFLFLLFTNTVLNAQKKSLVASFKNDKIVTVNRDISIDTKDKNALFLNAKKGSGLAILQNRSFTKGSIQIDIAGKNIPRKSFVGIAFNIQNDSTYEAIYFRPFNFKAKQQARKNHMVQYICHPEYTWHKLRNTRTGEFENELNPAPNPDDWFRVEIILNDTEVKVFVNGNKEKPDLVVKRLTTSKSDKIGLWVGNNSLGKFKELGVLKHHK